MNDLNKVKQSFRQFGWHTMCSNEQRIVPYGLKPAAISESMLYNPMLRHTIPQAAFDYHRAQLYDYTTRLRYGLSFPPSLHPYASPRQDYGVLGIGPHDPRARFLHEEPKPSHSYIGLIGMGIMSNPEKKMVLSDIYQYILDNYPYFRSRGPGWRNSIRHNLSLNDCFIKAGRSANGKGHYWAIHPANVEDFARGDFRRRRAQRKVRKHMGLTVPDDDEDDSPPPGPVSPTILEWKKKMEEYLRMSSQNSSSSSSGSNNSSSGPASNVEDQQKPDDDHSDRSVQSSPPACSPGSTTQPPPAPTKRRRLFDMESLLAPEQDKKQCRIDVKAVANGQGEHCLDGDIPIDCTVDTAGLRSRTDPVPVIRPTVVSYEAGHVVWSPPMPSGLWHAPTSAFTSIWRTPPPAHSFSATSNPAVSPQSLETITPVSAAEKWQETFSKILARSYSSTNNNNNNNDSGGGSSNSVKNSKIDISSAKTMN